jgi:hypothetical protein
LADGARTPVAARPATITTTRPMPRTTRSGNRLERPVVGAAGGTPPASQGEALVGGWAGAHGGVPAGWPVGGQADATGVAAGG